jgi:hypothetical protein
MSATWGNSEEQRRTVEPDLVGSSAATLTSAFNYSLGTYIRRGCYNSTIGAHVVEVLQRGVHRVTVILKILPTPPSIGTLHRRGDGALQLAVTIGELTAYQPSAYCS